MHNKYIDFYGKLLENICEIKGFARKILKMGEKCAGETHGKSVSLNKPSDMHTTHRHSHTHTAYMHTCTNTHTTHYNLYLCIYTKTTACKITIFYKILWYLHA